MDSDIEIDAPRASRLRRLILARAYVPEGLLRRLGWTTAGYIGVQVVRFASNLALTHILAPGLFGIMVLLTSIRVGLELFTDIGIGQNIIASRHAWEPDFYNTAWTLQLLRGLLLGLVALLVAPVVYRFYDQEALKQVLPLLSVLFILTGAHSVGLSLAVKGLETKRIAHYEVWTAALGAVVSVILALLFPNVWGLISGNIAATLITAALSYFVQPGVHHRLVIRREYLRGMVLFGRWIFLSSIVFFFASNYDRLILGKYISLAMLGIYGISRSLTDVFGQFAIRLGNAIIFPTIATTDLRGHDLKTRLAPRRLQFLTVLAFALSIFIALSDLIVGLLYDHRYAAAGQLLPWIGLATWVGIINTTNDSIMLGVSKPNYSAIGNLAKFMGLLLILPWAVMEFGVIGAAVTTAIAEAARYVVLVRGQSKEGVRFARQDLLSTLFLLSVVVLARTLSGALGLTGGVADLVKVSPITP